MGGGDKCLLRLGQGCLLTQVIDRLRPQVDTLVLNANGEPARFRDFGLPVIGDGVPGHAGPLAGVLAGLEWAERSGYSHVVTVAADTPFFPHVLVDTLRAAAAGEQVPLAMAVTPGSDGGVDRQPTFAWWPVKLHGSLRKALEDGLRKIVQFTEPRGCAGAVFPDPDAFFNVNTREDLTRARAMLAAVGG
jgi:molybdopterin-guanine dinucleotide biosynthesis protein A